MDGYFKTQECLEYFCGLVISDGHMRKSTRNRGCVSIELKDTDSDILSKLKNEILVNSTLRNRTRSSNFSNSFSSRTLNVFDKGFRDFIETLGVPYGKKNDVIIPEWFKFNSNFWRGMIDGDGSLGLVKKGYCFVSLITKSESVATSYMSLVSGIIGRSVNANRNKRDSVYNITVSNEDAKRLVNWLNYSSDLSLNRKRNKAKEVLSWKRPHGMRRAHRQKRWSKQEDDYILSHSLSDSVNNLKRTEMSIKMRLWRLKN
jgi:hypothetical protein